MPFFTPFQSLIPCFQCRCQFNSPFCRFSSLVDSENTFRWFWLMLLSVCPFNETHDYKGVWQNVKGDASSDWFGGDFTFLREVKIFFAWCFIHPVLDMSSGFRECFRSKGIRRRRKGGGGGTGKNKTGDENKRGERIEDIRVSFGMASGFNSLGTLGSPWLGSLL